VSWAGSYFLPLYTSWTWALRATECDLDTGWKLVSLLHLLARLGPALWATRFQFPVRRRKKSCSWWQRWALLIANANAVVALAVSVRGKFNQSLKMILFVDEEEIDKQINFTLPRERLSIHFSWHSPHSMRFSEEFFSLSIYIQIFTHCGEVGRGTWVEF
jgi:hypothetical protein